MQQWLDVSLDLDEGALAERWEGVVLVEREAIRALARENHMSLWRSTPVRYELVDGTVALDLTLRCVAHAHPDCRFRWVSLTVDFSAAPLTQVQDMVPRSNVTSAVEVTSSASIGATSYDVSCVPLAEKSAEERRHERHVYFPAITTSGPRLTYATWMFAAMGDQPLHVDRDLRLLLTTPSSAGAVPAAVTLRGEVVVNGRAGRLPLVGRRTAEFSAGDDLAGASGGCGVGLW